jgi:hypothetical protein
MNIIDSIHVIDYYGCPYWQACIYTEDEKGKRWQILLHKEQKDDECCSHRYRLTAALLFNSGQKP